MRLALGSLLLILCAACSEPADEARAPAESVASDPAQTRPLDPAKAKAFLAYQEKLIPLLRKVQETGNEYQGVNELEGRFSANIEEIDMARKELGLTRQEISAFSTIHAGILARGAARRAGADPDRHA